MFRGQRVSVLPAWLRDELVFGLDLCLRNRHMLDNANEKAKENNTEASENYQSIGLTRLDSRLVSCDYI